MTTVTSSTFSSDRAPKASFFRPLLAGLIGAVALVAAYEAALRVAGGRASVALSAPLWALQLDRAIDDPNPDTTVVLGDSRSRGAISSKAFASRFPDIPIYRLSTSGESPIAALVYLARRTEFAGNIIVDLNESNLESDIIWTQQYLLDFYEDNWTWNVRANTALEVSISRLLVIRQSGHSLVEVLRAVIDKDPLQTIPFWSVNTPDYESFYDFSGVERIDDVRRGIARSTRVADPAWFENLAMVLDTVRILRTRGASVAFVRLPTAGTWWRNDSVRWPRAAYWDRLATEPGLVALHFEDDPSLSGFALPDLSHIDQRDKEAFTDALLDALIARGMPFDRTGP